MQLSHFRRKLVGFGGLIGHVDVAGKIEVNIRIAGVTSYRHRNWRKAWHSAMYDLRRSELAGEVDKADFTFGDLYDT